MDKRRYVKPAKAKVRKAAEQHLEALVTNRWLDVGTTYLKTMDAIIDLNEIFKNKYGAYNNILDELIRIEGECKYTN